MTEWVASMGLGWYILFFLFVSLINVVFNTLKTIITSRGKKIPACIINALTFGFYTLVVALTANMSNLWINMAITIIANLIGVYLSISILDKLRKDCLWEVTATVCGEDKCENICKALQKNNISFNLMKTLNKTEREYAFHIYCPTQAESTIVKEVLVNNNARYIVHEENAKL